MSDRPQLDLDEEIARITRINQMQAEFNEQQCRENLRARAPWQIILFCMTAGAAFFAAGFIFEVALTRLAG